MRAKIYTPVHQHETIEELWEIVSDDNETQLIHAIPPLAVPEIIFYIGRQFQIQNVPAKFGILKGQYIRSIVYF